ncbi:methyl-accepting chemotaxis sensory transducer with GAF sensor [Chondrocystis sp. NIES-4102]|nr:methyl-accepting chemotaxis sensory transducer with GAF sensor [Chondrocystis sp. NIES-4102]
MNNLPDFQHLESEPPQVSVNSDLSGTKTSFVQQLYSLPIKRKTALIPWFSFGGLILVLGAGGLIIYGTLKNQLLQQAESRLAVTDIQYNIKIDQMGFGFRGQSDNSAIIAAATSVAQGQPLTADLRTQVTKILQNEIKTRKIEYATLVGRDKKIIVNANANRAGQTFDPNGLVSQVLKNPQQIKTSQILSWQELQIEKPPLPNGLQAADVLVRYTATPLFNADKSQVLGVLISGDIVNGKSTIVENTVAAFGKSQSYSAVYLYQLSGDFSLSTSWNNFLGETQTDITLDNTNILNQAIANPEAIITGFDRVKGKSLALAAHAITNETGEAVGVVVYGSPKSSINSLLYSSLLTQFLLAIIVLIILIYLSKILEQAISGPIQTLQKVAQEFSEGNTQVRASIVTTDEVGLLGTTFNLLADSIEINEAKLKQDAERSRILKEIALDIATARNIEQLLQLAVDTSKRVLQVERVIYHQFDANWQGKVIAEAVDLNYPAILNTQIDDPCFAQGYAEKYQQGEVKAIANIYQAGLQDCHLKMLEPFAIIASLIVPVVINERLVGLLIAHQCSEPKTWQADEINLLSQIAYQVGNALEKIELSNKQKQAEQQERTAKENLQRRALELLMEVDPVSRGDLTVRVKVQEDEIGTIGDSYNATIESLRKLVAQVQSAASLVFATTSDKDLSIQELSLGAAAQTEEIKAALTKIEGITQSIQAVASNAKSAEAAVLKAAETVKAGDDAMNQTVAGFQEIRDTVAATAKKVKRLGESSQKISKVVNVISNFADQTNLLALNASIEAAHAGEEGRGFAVVADEVRSLARKSAEATAEIEALVAEIQAETNEVVAAMESGTEQVVAGTKLVDRTRDSLIEIADVSQVINKFVAEIAAATVEQSQDSQLVSQTMLQVAAISNKTASEVDDVSASFKELLAVAQQLQSSVAEFKVG